MIVFLAVMPSAKPGVCKHRSRMWKHVNNLPETCFFQKTDRLDAQGMVTHNNLLAANQNEALISPNRLSGTTHHLQPQQPYVRACQLCSKTKGWYDSCTSPLPLSCSPFHTHTHMHVTWPPPSSTRLSWSAQSSSILSPLEHYFVCTNI